MANATQQIEEVNNQKVYVRRKTAEAMFDFPDGYLLENQDAPRCKRGKYLYFVPDELRAWIESGRVK